MTFISTQCFFFLLSNPFSKKLKAIDFFLIPFLYTYSTSIRFIFRDWTLRKKVQKVSFNLSRHKSEDLCVLQKHCWTAWTEHEGHQMVNWSGVGGGGGVDDWMRKCVFAAALSAHSMWPCLPSLYYGDISARPCARTGMTKGRVTPIQFPLNKWHFGQSVDFWFFFFKAKERRPHQGQRAACEVVRLQVQRRDGIVNINLKASQFRFTLS